MVFIIYFFFDCNLFKAEFLASLLQFSVSRGPSKIILICWFGPYGRSLLSLLKMVVLINIFMETMIHFFQESSKSLFEIKYFVT